MMTDEKKKILMLIWPTQKGPNETHVGSIQPHLMVSDMEEEYHSHKNPIYCSVMTLTTYALIICLFACFLH